MTRDPDNTHLLALFTQFFYSSLRACGLLLRPSMKAHRRVHLAFVIATVAAFAAGCSSAARPSSSSQAKDTATASTDADGGAWCHDYLAASDGTTTFDVDYQLQYTSSYPGSPSVVSMAPLWINVAGDFTGSEQVSATIVELDQSPSASAPSVTGSTVVALTWNGSVFTGQAPNPLPIMTPSASGDGDDAFSSLYQFAIEIDGNWLTDPVSGTHNFQYNPRTQGASAYCQGFGG
jgi:hypothetical protein